MAAKTKQSYWAAPPCSPRGSRKEEPAVARGKGRGGLVIIRHRPSPKRAGSKRPKSRGAAHPKRSKPNPKAKKVSPPSGPTGTGTQAPPSPGPPNKKKRTQAPSRQTDVQEWERCLLCEEDLVAPEKTAGNSVGCDGQRGCRFGWHPLCAPKTKEERVCWRCLFEM